MKKLLAILLAVTVLGSFSACSSVSDDYEELKTKANTIQKSETEKNSTTTSLKNNVEPSNGEEVSPDILDQNTIFESFAEPQTISGQLNFVTNGIAEYEGKLYVLLSVSSGYDKTVNEILNLNIELRDSTGKLIAKDTFDKITPYLGEEFNLNNGDYCSTLLIFEKDCYDLSNYNFGNGILLKFEYYCEFE